MCGAACHGRKCNLAEILKIVVQDGEIFHTTYLYYIDSNTRPSMEILFKYLKKNKTSI
jgi:hypothetical protein